jgi:hypothetical protein
VLRQGEGGKDQSKYHLHQYIPKSHHLTSSMGIHRSDCHMLGITDFDDHVLVDDMRCTGSYVCRASFHGAVAFLRLPMCLFETTRP